MCCPEVGWVIYDIRESPYALCERAMARQGGGGSSLPSGSSDLDTELRIRRHEIEERRIALEERRFQQQLQVAMMRGQLKRAAAAAANSPEARAARREEQRAMARAAARAEERRKAEETKKYLLYGGAALFAAKFLKMF
jgi:ribosomal protein L12E/L44/L45/RPP1/RPP2